MCEISQTLIDFHFYLKVLTYNKHKTTFFVFCHICIYNITLLASVSKSYCYSQALVLALGPYRNYIYNNIFFHHFVQLFRDNVWQGTFL